MHLLIYTEKKRIRKSFGKRENVLNVPYLLATQKESYVAFLQDGRAAAEAQARRPAGGLPVRVPDRVAQRVRRDEVHRIQHGQARRSTSRNASSAD